MPAPGSFFKPIFIPGVIRCLAPSKSPQSQGQPHVLILFVPLHTFKTTGTIPGLGHRFWIMAATNLPVRLLFFYATSQQVRRLGSVQTTGVSQFTPSTLITIIHMASVSDTARCRLFIDGVPKSDSKVRVVRGGPRPRGVPHLQAP